MIIKARIDENGYFISNYTENHIKEEWHMVEPYNGTFIQPKWNGSQWIEGATEQQHSEWLAGKIALLKAEQFAELQPTDWYIIRQMDTGVPVPEHIREQRAAIRAKYDALIAALQ
jgi:hypothetical protein